MAKAITGRITLNLIAGIVITVVTVLGTIWWMATKHDEQAARNTQTMVAGGMQAMGKRLAQLANDYGWWEEAYDAYVRKDKNWIESNIGTGITDTNIADLLFIVSPKGKIDYSWINESAKAKVEEIVTAPVMAEIRKIADGLPVANLAGKSGIYVNTPTVPMMLSIQHIAPVSKADKVKAANLPIIVFGLYLGRSKLGDLGKSFLIDDLKFARGDVAPEPETAVVSLTGQSLGYIDWTPPKPGNALLRSVLGPIAIALTLFCIVALTTAFRARKMAIALTQSEQEAVTAARTDSLTGLMNRTGLVELLDSKRYTDACRDLRLAIIYLDINGFKAVNDSIGHGGGDELVKALAARIAAIVPPAGAFARIGGDEFAIAVVADEVRTAASGTASAVVHALDQPFTVSGFEFHVTASVGYAVTEGGEMNPSEVIRRADLAMYQAKNGAEREPIAYHSTMETGALEKKQIETGLRHAIEKNELKVFYQPVVRSGDLGFVGFEALVRWQSEQFGAVSPAVFIPVAEDTGLIHDIGRFVADRACQDLHRWPGLHMAINVSPVQLREPNFADGLRKLVESHGHHPSRFQLELTEGILVNNPTIAERKLAMLKEYGFTLALDDFGTGFSSIGYLRQFPFDILKIDRSFVRDIGMNATANALIQSLVSLGDALELDVIAEGIENEDQLKLLRLIQCEYIQGFMISKPVSADDIDGLLAARQARVHAAAGPVPLERRVAAST
ncbi:EAL domain-containing protein [soil metagenome]